MSYASFLTLKNWKVLYNLNWRFWTSLPEPNIKINAVFLPYCFVGSGEEKDDATEIIDVFVSYAKINCPSALRSQEAGVDLPPSYEEAIWENMCDPRDIVVNLKATGKLKWLVR